MHPLQEYCDNLDRTIGGTEPLALERQRIAQVSIDYALRALRLAHGRCITLSPRAFALVAYLFENNSRIVGKGELLAALWPQGATEHALRQEIYALRRQLAHEGVSSCIVTVPQKGYRFDGNPSPLEDATSAALRQLSDSQRRAIAATALFENKSDILGWKRALFWYERLSASAASLIDAHVGAARAAIRLGLRSALPSPHVVNIAMSHLQSALHASPSHPRARVLEAVLQGVFLRDFDRAKDALLCLSCEQPQMSQPRCGLALLHFSFSRIEESLAYQREALALAPQMLDAHLQYGFLSLYAGDLQVAQQQFSFVLHLQADNVDACEGLATVHVLRQCFDNALGLLEAAPWSVPTAALMVVASARAGNRLKARQLFDGLLSSAGQHVSGIYQARCHYALGDPGGAMRALNLAAREPLAHCAQLDPLMTLDAGSH